MVGVEIDFDVDVVRSASDEFNMRRLSRFGFGGRTRLHCGSIDVMSNIILTCGYCVRCMKVLTTHSPTWKSKWGRKGIA